MSRSRGPNCRYHLETLAPAAARLDAIRTIFYGGAPMYVEDRKRALDTIGPRLLEACGQGEMPNTITYLPKRMHTDSTYPRYEERLASVGIARTGVGSVSSIRRVGTLRRERSGRSPPAATFA